MVVQLLSHVWLFVILWTAAHQASSVLHYLPEFAQIHVYWVSDANHLILRHLLLLLQYFPALGSPPMRWLCELSCSSRVWLCATLWTITSQAPLAMGLSRQEHWSGLLCAPPGDLPNPGVEPMSLTSPALAGWILDGISETPKQSQQSGTSTHFAVWERCIPICSPLLWFSPYLNRISSWYNISEESWKIKSQRWNSIWPFLVMLRWN